MNYTRDGIKQRMLKRIAQMWEVDQPESLDPVVKMLAESMAEEIFSLSGELDRLDERLLSKQSAAYTPPQMLVARPSHALMRAYPSDATFNIDSQTEFFCKEAKELKKYGVNHIKFTPISSFSLFKGQITHLNICGQMYQYDADNRRSTVAFPEKHTKAIHRTVWIGIDAADSEIESLANLSLYFDFMQIEDKYSYLKLLSAAKWSMGSETVNVDYGICPKIEPDDDDIETHSETLAFQKSALDSILSDIRSLYEIHYVTVRSHSATKMNLPKDLEEVYDSETLSQFTKPLFWFRIEFPPGVTRDILENIKVSMNIFPVANISRTKVSKLMSNIPIYMTLETDANEFFVEVNSVFDSSGMEYGSVDSQGNTDNAAYYALRKGGVERHSSTNDAVSTMARMNNVMRDHTLIGNSRKDSNFKQLIEKTGENVDKIADTLHYLGEPRYKSYVTIGKTNKGETLYVDYYITNGATINRFKPDSTFGSNLGAGIDNNRSFLATPARSGENDPDDEKIRDRFRYMLLSKDSLYTKHDIINFCMAEYGKDILKVDVKRGRRISKKEKEGVQKTIDVHIELKPKSSLKSMKEIFKTDLVCKLENRSPDDYIYQLFVD